MRCPQNRFPRSVFAGALLSRATYIDFERRFAQFLDAAPDVLRFAALGTTEQGESGTQFRVGYLKSSGAIGFYHPDWLVVQKSDTGEVNWIIETKGRVWEGTAAKDEAIQNWCEGVSSFSGAEWRFIRINQADFRCLAGQTLATATTTSDGLSI